MNTETKQTQTCKDCGKEKPLKNFGTYKSRDRYFRRKVCYSCRSAKYNRVECSKCGAEIWRKYALPGRLCRDCGTRKPTISSATPVMLLEKCLRPDTAGMII